MAHALLQTSPSAHAGWWGGDRVCVAGRRRTRGERDDRSRTNGVALVGQVREGLKRSGVGSVVQADDRCACRCGGLRFRHGEARSLGGPAADHRIRGPGFDHVARLLDLSGSRSRRARRPDRVAPRPPTRDAHSFPRSRRAPTTSTATFSNGRCSVRSQRSPPSPESAAPTSARHVDISRSSRPGKVRSGSRASRSDAVPEKIPPKRTLLHLTARCWWSAHRQRPHPGSPEGRLAPPGDHPRRRPPTSRAYTRPRCRETGVLDVSREDNGAPDRIRTCDLRLRRPTLYPLSYRRARRRSYRSGLFGPERAPIFPPATPAPPGTARANARLGAVPKRWI